MIEVINNINDFELIREDCNRLADKFKMPLLRFEWLKNCITTFHKESELKIFVNRKDGRITAIAPLVLEENNLSKRLEIIGTEAHREPGGFLYEDLESLTEVLRYAFNNRSKVFLKGIRKISPESNSLEYTLRQRKAVTSVITENIPFLRIEGTWEDFQQKISSSRRSSLRRLKKLAEKEGTLSVEIVTPTLENFYSGLEEIYNVESSGWKTRFKTAMRLNSQLGEFFEHYSYDAIKHGCLKFCFLRINGEAAAVQIGIEYANRYWTLKIGYNEKYAKCSPGILLMNEVIKCAFEKKLDAIELLGSNEEWLHIWPIEYYSLASYRIYNSLFSGIFNLALDFTQSRLNKFRTKSAKNRKAGRAIQPMIKEKIVEIIGKRHVAGENLIDALKTSNWAFNNNWGSAISAWTSDNEDKFSVANKYKEIINVITKGKLNSYVSIKPHSMNYDLELLDSMIVDLKNSKIRVHIDSLFPETADKTLKFFVDAKSKYDNIGYTLPSRWKRSLDDAEVLIKHNAAVRIVKGQWIDPDNPDIDPRKNYIDLVKKLTNKVPMIGIATHDKEVAIAAIDILKNSTTKFELEQFFSLPLITKKISKTHNAPVRIYVPYGTGYLPYNTNQMRVRPAILFWLLRDLLSFN